MGYSLMLYVQMVLKLYVTSLFLQSYCSFVCQTGAAFCPLTDALWVGWGKIQFFGEQPHEHYLRLRSSQENRGLQ